VKRRELLLILLMLFSSVFLLIFAKSGYVPDAELFSEEEYPEDLNSLEEFIQSYYLLLDSDAYLKNYSFIDPAKNEIQNNQDALEPFYLKLLQLRNGLRDEVVIYQIGDSHVQSGYFSGTARSALQKYFGNAGRGLIFPNKLAKTNQPDDYQISSDTRFGRIDKPRSMGGFTLANQGESELRIKTNSFFKIDCTFDQALVYADRSANLAFDKQPGIKHLDRAEIGDYSIHHLSYEEAANSAVIALPASLKELYGISLEREEAGLLYHSMGVNGAGFYNLADSREMFSQIALLKPDLLIVSLGTNDAQGTFRAEVMRKNLQSFMANLTLEHPDVPVLFTLPPDSRKNGKANKDITAVGKIISDYARANNYAVWDLQEVMGGNSSVAKWRANSMAAKDHLHFTPKGYMLQGHLLYQAMIKGYKTFSETRDK
jgi:lysophospholipase L1-like esterase